MSMVLRPNRAAWGVSGTLRSGIAGGDPGKQDEEIREGSEDSQKEERTMRAGGLARERIDWTIGSVSRRT